ncbi:MAG: hypothetical protein SAJ37_05570 [Oscillatoria sp. PMC 1068.18]|nr:hypothetical protein [Oscillatoria sp. PMC 1076.18]MEC4988199.1 hypothetical protein [Oscillatoria sp. PMC 1068.18]
MNQPSSSEQLHHLISTKNPFNRELIVKKQNVWGQSFPDVPSINTHASDAVFRAVEEVRSGQRNVVGITIKAEKGLGKTHLISRIRHKLQEKGGALFVYMTEYNDLNSIKPEFLKNLVFSLKEEGSQKVSQWQELATALVNEARNRTYDPIQLVNGFTQVLEKNPHLVDKLTDKVLELKPGIDNPDLVKAILWTLDKKHAPYAYKWLSGKSIPQSKANKMDLPNDSDEDKEAESFDTTCQLLDLISDYNPLVICFDQLEGTEVSDGGYTKAQVIATFAMDLYNSMKRGIILTALYPDIWVSQIRAIPSAEAVIDRIGERIFELDYLDSERVFDLVGQYLDEFYQENQVTPSDRVYPFAGEKLKELGKQKATARDVLQWCQKNWLLSVPSAEPKEEKKIKTEENDTSTNVELAYNNELKNIDLEEALENETKIAKALVFGFEQMIGHTLEGVTIKQIESPLKPKNKYLNLKVIGEENGKQVKIGVAVMQTSAGRTVTAGLSHLSDYKKYDLTRGCLVRSKKISPSAKKAHDNLTQLLGQKGGEWVLLKEEEVKPLLAIYSVDNTREERDISKEDVMKFIADQNLIVNNPLLLEILSDPSGEVPENAVDEEAIFDEPETNENFDLNEVDDTIDDLEE